MNLPGTGPDFRRARQGWLYETYTGQPLIAAIAMAVALFVINSLLQYLFGVAGYFLFLSDPADLTTNNFAKASILGLLPSALITIAAALHLQHFWNPGRRAGIPLHVPALGPVGWILVVAGFTLAMYLIYVAVFVALGLDPQNYVPGSGGVEDTSNAAGLVEKAMADLADEPLLFAIALPGVAIAVPVAEEVMFRGALFSALLRSPLGKPGAVVITAALWAVVHGAAAPWLFVGIIFIMGLCLGLLLLRFGSLWVTIACHCVWNALSSLAILGNVGNQ